MSTHRHHGESFEDYKARRNEEKKLTAQKLKGTVVHTASIMMSGTDMVKHWRKRNPDATPGEIETAKTKFPRNKFFKVSLQGTYRKPGEEGQ